MHDGLRTIDVHLALVELAAALSEEELEEVLHVAFTMGFVLSRLFTKAAAPARLPRRRGVGSMRRIIEDIDTAGGFPTTRFESRLFDLMKRASLPMPVPQYVVNDSDGWSARIDFAFPSQKVGIEAFSFRWHGNKSRSVRDARRRTRLAVMGWIILEITWEDMIRRPEEVISRVDRALGRPRLTDVLLS